MLALPGIHFASPSTRLRDVLTATLSNGVRGNLLCTRLGYLKVVITRRKNILFRTRKKIFLLIYSYGHLSRIKNIRKSYKETGIEFRLDEERLRYVVFKSRK